MAFKKLERLSIIIVMMFTFTNTLSQSKEQVVRIAKIIVAPDQLDQYKTTLKEAIETAVRTEPGVLAYYAVADKNNANHITILEVYKNMEAYKSHIETTHFKKYKSDVQNIVQALELIDVDVIDFVTK